MEDENIIKEEYKCPRCNSTLKEKKPKDRRIIKLKEFTVRLYCSCGYYTDIIIDTKSFK